MHCTEQESQSTLDDTKRPMRISEYLQGSTEWHDCRRGVVTASNFSKVFTTKGKLSASREGLINQLIAENVTGEKTPTFKSDAMQRGNDLEPEARSYAEMILNKQITEVGLVKVDDHEIGCSPDGLIGIIGIEFKCPSPSTMISYQRLAGHKLPAAYIQQVQGTMWVLGMQSYWFFAYHPTMPPYLMLVERDDKLLTLAEPLLIETAEIIKYETERLRN